MGMTLLYLHEPFLLRKFFTAVMNAPFAVKAKHYLVLLHVPHAFLWRQSISTKKQWLVGSRLAWLVLGV
ncbi:MAG: hypothetical protein LRY49_06565 [Burkholderiaceae bacterium]|nr:hypothetical protein [Burkholderiaceae bacterium]